MPKIREVIPDSGLYLGTIDELMGHGGVILEELQAVLDAAIATIRSTEEFWYEEDGIRSLNVDEFQDEILTVVVETFGGLEIDEAQLQEITSLNFDGGNEVYMWLEGATAESLGLEDWELDTGGESDIYTVRSFDGILALPNLEVLNLDAYGYTNVPRDASDLLRCKSLKTVKQALSLDDATKAALIAAGVEVT